MLHSLRDGESPGVFRPGPGLPRPIRSARPRPIRSVPPRLPIPRGSRVYILPYDFSAYGRLPALSSIKYFRGLAECTLWVAFSAHSAASHLCIWASTCAFAHQIISGVGRMYTWAGPRRLDAPVGLGNSLERHRSAGARPHGRSAGDQSRGYEAPWGANKTFSSKYFFALNDPLVKCEKISLYHCSYDALTCDFVA